MSNKKIAWERWDEDVIEQEMVENFFAQFETEEEFEEAQDALSFLEKIPSLVTTPMGMYQLHDKMNIMTQFDCWRGYTNFDITTSVQDALESVDGVELLEVMSRYRFFLGVGKLFNFSDVRRDVEEQLCDNFELDSDTEETVEMIKESLSSDRFWTIFVSGNGEILYASTNEIDDKNYLNQIKTYNKQRNLHGGLFFENE